MITRTEPIFAGFGWRRHTNYVSVGTSWVHSTRSPGTTTAEAIHPTFLRWVVGGVRDCGGVGARGEEQGAVMCRACTVRVEQGEYL